MLVSPVMSNTLSPDFTTVSIFYSPEKRTCSVISPVHWNIAYGRTIQHNVKCQSLIIPTISLIITQVLLATQLSWIDMKIMLIKLGEMACHQIYTLEISMVLNRKTLENP